MAKLFPMFLALIFSFFSQCFACDNAPHITGTQLMFSTYLIRFALYFLLLEAPLYLRTFRRIHSLPENIFQFIIGLFIIESGLVFIWFPLENAFLCIIPVISKILYPYFRNSAMLQNILWYNMNVVENNVVFLATSYFVSFTILFCILHGTRAVDFRLISKYGFYEFFDDSMRRLRKGFVKLIPKQLKRERRTSRRRVKRVKSCSY